MRVKETVIGELMRNAPKGATPELLKDGIAFSTKNRRLEYHVRLKNYPERKVKNLTRLLSKMTLFLDEKRFARGVKDLKAVVVIYDSAFGVKFTTVRRGRELGEIVFSALKGRRGARVWGAGGLGDPGFIDFGISMLEEYVRTAF